MTTTESAPNSAPIVVRQQPTPSVPAAGIAGITGELSEVERVCNMVASAGDMCPVAYRGKPGAVLLAKMWADRHGVDLLTAVQNVYPIEGRPFVSAEMRVALAVDAGVEFRVTESTAEVCTIEVWGPDNHVDEHGVHRDRSLRGKVTCRFDDRPRKLKTAKGHDTPWALHPDDMLFAEACRKADRRYVKTGAALIDTGQDYDDDPVADPVTVLAPADTTDPADVVEAEIVDENVVADVRALLIDKGVKAATLTKWLNAEHGLGSIDDLATADPGVVEAAFTWINSHGAPPPPAPAGPGELPSEPILRDLIATRSKTNKRVSVTTVIKATQAQFPDRAGDLADLAGIVADPQALDFALGWIEHPTARKATETR